MKSKLTIFSILATVLLLAGASVYVAFYLSDDNIAPDDSSAASCSGLCGSGATCTVAYVGRTPSAGNMFSCVNYQCVEVQTNQGDDRCYLDCNNGWQPCGCNIQACRNQCRQTYAGQEGEHFLTITCALCKQPFTCDCEITTVTTPPPVTDTLTPTPTRTNTPTLTATPTSTTTPTPTTTITITDNITNTPTPTFTVTLTVTTPITLTPQQTLPPTAIISDELDKFIIGFVMILIGYFVYKYVSKNSVYID